MRRFLFLLVVSAMTALLLTLVGAAAAQEVVRDPSTGTGPTGGDAPNLDAVVVPPDRPPGGGGVDEIDAADVVVDGDATSGQAVAPEEDATSHPVNKDPGTNDSSTVENPKTGVSIHCSPGFKLVKGEDPSGQGDQCAPMDEEASAPGAVKAEEVPGGITPTTQENDASAPKAVSASDEAGQIANSPTANSPTANSPTANSSTIYGCPYADDEYEEEFDVCFPSNETLDFVDVVSGQEPWPDTAGEYVNFLGGINSDLPMLLGVAIKTEGQLIENFLDWYGEDGGPIGWGLQAVGYTVSLGSDVIGGLLQGAGQAADTLHEGLGAVVDTVADAAGDAWDAISDWW